MDRVRQEVIETGRGGFSPWGDKTELAAHLRAYPNTNPRASDDFRVLSSPREVTHGLNRTPSGSRRTLLFPRPHDLAGRRAVLHLSTARNRPGARLRGAPRRLHLLRTRCRRSLRQAACPATLHPAVPEPHWHGSPALHHEQRRMGDAAGLRAHRLRAGRHAKTTILPLE